MLPLTLVLRKMKAGYKLKKNMTSVNHFLFMDDLNLIQDGFFRGCSRMGGGGQKNPPTPAPINLPHISYNDKTWHSYTLPKEDPKTIWITWHIPWVLLISAFFTGNQQIFLYQEIQIYIPFRYIISISSKISWVSKDCFNKHGHNFDEVSKNG